MKKFDEMDDWSEYKKTNKKKSKHREDSDHNLKSNTRNYVERDYERTDEPYKFRRGK